MDEENCPIAIVCDIQGAGEQIASAANFASDPWGNIYDNLANAAKTMSESFLPALVDVVQPDLTADWFLRAYAVAFAIAIFAASILMLRQFGKASRGDVGSAAAIQRSITGFIAFMVGATFGPFVGWFLVEGTHALTNSIISWGVTGSSQAAAAGLAELAEYDAAAAPGGLVLGSLLMLCMVIGLVGVLVMLVVQLVTLYFTGILVPLALIWFLDAEKTDRAKSFLGLWLGILLAHPLLFFLLGAAYWMMGDAGSVLAAESPLHAIVQIIVAVIALFVATFSPLLLMKFAPILPGGAGVPTPPSSGQPIGPRSTHEAADRQSQPPNSMNSGDGQGSMVRHPSGPSSTDAAPSAPQPTSPSATGDAASQGGSAGQGASAAQAAETTGGAAQAAGSAAQAAGTAAEATEVAGAATAETGVGAAVAAGGKVAAETSRMAAKAAQATQDANESVVSAMDDRDDA